MVCNIKSFPGVLGWWNSFPSFIYFFTPNVLVCQNQVVEREPNVGNWFYFITFFITLSRRIETFKLNLSD